MSSRRIFCFGDSFTVGEGANLKLTREIESLFDSKTIEGRAKSSELIREINTKLSWSQYLADYFKVHVVNQGESGANNIKIFNNIFDYQAGGDSFTKKDLVIVMWSSSIRNKLPWFPSIFAEAGPVGAGWSLKELLGKDAERAFTDRYYSSEVKPSQKEFIEKTLTPFMGDYFKTYITDLYDDSFYNTVNLNLVKFVQDYFDYRGINYLMIDAFEPMDSFKPKRDSKWQELIDTSKYLGFGETTAWDMLNEIGGDIWEDTELSYSPEGQRCHPNHLGYKLLGEKIAEFIEENIWQKSAI